MSFGLSQLKPTDKNIEECIERADEALYASKRNGRNKVTVN